MPPFPDKQAAVVPHRRALTGRHKAPTGAPKSTKVRVGGEGTPSRAMAACPLHATAQRGQLAVLPDVFRMLLDVERAESESVAYMRELARAAFGSPSLEPLMTALVSIEYQWRETVWRISQRGGLLLIGGRA